MGTFLTDLRLWFGVLVLAGTGVLMAAEDKGVVWKPYTVYVKPDRSVVTIKVQFEKKETVRLLCGGAVGCFKGKADDKGRWIEPPLLIVPAPTSFNDQYALTVLGHEVLHALGAYHD